MPPAPAVITRFAPSPTGHLHIGGARTALFCWAFARRHALTGGGGHFLLRVEDTDQARSSESSARGILEDLAWLGILWDEGPRLEVAPLSERCSGVQRPTASAYGSESRATIGGDPRNVGPFFQAQRIDLYNKYIEQLVAAGKAYPAFESPEELDAKRKAAQAAKQTYRYDRAALSIPHAERLPRMHAAAKDSKPFVVRLLMPDQPVHVTDEVLGEVKYAAGDLDDFVLRKADGFPTYHFAVVVDDELMGVTHVLRGQEHLNNTPRHVALQQALGFRTPKYAHMPLIFNMDSSKMSKRDKDKAVREACKKAGLKVPPIAGVDEGQFQAWLGDTQRQLPADVLEPIAQRLQVAMPEVEVEDFRRAGYLPEVICNFIALLGWSPGENREKFDMDFLARHFSLERIGRANARFDRVKLLSFNADAIGAMSDDEFARRWRRWCEAFEPTLPRRFTDRQFTMLAKAVRPRAKTFRDALKPMAFALADDDQIRYDGAAVEKNLLAADRAGLKMLADLRAVLAKIDPFDPAPISAAIEELAQGKGVGMGQVAQPLRVAIAGIAVSPPLGETLAVLGRDSTLRRIDRCLAAHPG